MKIPINIYCDESCHLEHDGKSHMVLGALWCEESKVKEVSARIIEIKTRHLHNPKSEVKWNKVSEGGVLLYEDLLNFFFDDDDLHFRALIADKSVLDHKTFKQTHDEWYYKMYFHLLKVILSPDNSYNVYLDIKDTLGGEKVKKLKEVLSNSMFDFNRDIFSRFQLVRSDESALLQLSDLLIGAVSYNVRDLSRNSGKNKIIDLVKRRSGYSLTKSTLYKENKFNLFFWKPNNHEE